MKHIILLLIILSISISSFAQKKEWHQSDRQPRSTMGIICRNDSLIIENPFLIKVIMVGDKAYRFNVELKEVEKPNLLSSPNGNGRILLGHDGWINPSSGRKLIIDTTTSTQQLSIEW